MLNIPREGTHYTINVDTGCWEWCRGRMKFGYGRMAQRRGARKLVLAHRQMYEIHVGPIPAGRCVLHTCDNPPCINPAHLRVGTYADNNRDAVEKGRARKARGGEKPNAILTERDVRQIREDLARDGSYGAGAALARRYGVSKYVISDIRRGKAWKHVH